MIVSIWSYADLSRTYGLVWSMCKYLREIGCSVNVVYVSDKGSTFVDDNGIRITAVRSVHRKGLLRALRFFGEVFFRRKHSDLIIMIGSRSSLFSWPAWKFARCRTMVFAYELDGDGWMELVANRILQSVDFLVEANNHRARLRKKLARKPDAVVKNHPDEKTRDTILLLYNSTRSPICHKVMYGGLIAHYQGIDLLVKGFAQSNARCLEIIGPYEDPSYIEMLRSIQIPSDKELIISAPMPRQLLLEKLWNEASLLACLYPYLEINGRMNRLNTKYAEPSKYYEYLLLGIPFVRFDHPSLPRKYDNEFIVGQDSLSIAEGINAALDFSINNNLCPKNPVHIQTYESQLHAAFSRMLEFPELPSVK